MTALMVLGLVAVVVGSGMTGWMVAARRHHVTETTLRVELAAQRSSAEESQARHEAIVGELTRTALRVIRTQGGGESS